MIGLELDCTVAIMEIKLHEIKCRIRIPEMALHKIIPFFRKQSNSILIYFTTQEYKENGFVSIELGEEWNVNIRKFDTQFSVSFLKGNYVFDCENNQILNFLKGKVYKFSDLKLSPLPLIWKYEGETLTIFKPTLKYLEFNGKLN